MSDQRRLDGVRQTTPKPEVDHACADCGTFEDLTYYPSVDEHSCKPCSNGAPEEIVKQAARDLFPAVGPKFFDALGNEEAYDA